MARRHRGLILTLLLLIAHSAAAIDFSDIYASITDGIEEAALNTGLTIFPTLLIPAGGEFEGMGTAYTAVARDVSFLEANAAASSTLEFTEVTFIHNNWIADTSVEGVVSTLRLGDLGLAFGGKFLHVPFTRYNALTEQVASGRYSEGTIGANVSYNFLRSYYYAGLSAGLTAKVIYRTIPQSVAPNQSAIGFAVDLGVLSRFNLFKFYASRDKNFGVGLSIRNIGPPVKEEPLPSQATLGVAYSPVRPVIVATDFIVPFTLSATVPWEGVGAAMGVAVDVVEFFSAQAGLLLRAGGPRITLGADFRLTDVSFNVNYTLDMATQLAAFDRFSVQARLNLGDRGRGLLRDTVDMLYLDAWTQSAAGNLEESIRLASKAYELDPTFQPARELLEITQRTLDLQNELRSIELKDLDSVGGAVR